MSRQAAKEAGKPACSFKVVRRSAAARTKCDFFSSAHKSISLAALASRHGVADHFENRRSAAGRTKCGFFSCFAVEKTATEWRTTLKTGVQSTTAECTIVFDRPASDSFHG